ncbi:MAG: glycogen/starch/alpha-glucan phosphorylase [Deltaproteobacteria bacterium]|nr:glycogen/starch/alpha-glucan phosphorylase [Deltaproteobacteria bacterium]
MPDKNVEIVVEDDRTGMDPVVLQRAFLDHVRYSQGKHPATATGHDRFMALALMVRDRLIQRWMATQECYYRADAKRVYYLSAEFLLGRALKNNLLNTGIYEDCKRALGDARVDLDALLEEEVDAGLGNGGLGRLAACFLDSMATLGLAGYGYGIRYEFGIFEQRLADGFQVERPDEWLRFGNPWELVRPEYTVTVQLGGRCEETQDARGRFHVRWIDTQKVLGVPYDTPVAGYGTLNVNTLRLWRARASAEFDLDVFNKGDYVRAVEDKNASETISKVLYPSDSSMAGRELRLKQQYFFVACAVADIVRRYKKTHATFEQFPDKVAIQLNDTHPAIAVVELLRVLLDEHDLPWDQAWDLTVATCGYTNHTLLSEALERWPVTLFERLLPRHLQLIYEVNRRFLRQVMNRWPNDGVRAARMSLIEEGAEKQVRMAHLAVVGAHKVNGVAALHTELLKRDVLHDFHEMMPERFTNKTNGVTPRRWLLACNPRLSSLITERLGEGWPKDLDRLEGLTAHADDPDFRRRFTAVKRANKADLVAWIRAEYGVAVAPESLFDVQIKRIHEYKRQLLNALHVVGLYLRAKRDPSVLAVPRTFLFAGKAAPAYRMAKLIIKLITAVAEVVNGDPTVPGLKVLFLPNYSVSLGEKLFPAADLSEQISTAGKEASGTGNMKFSLNGALTIGTLDGANVEIREAVGPENFFLFGMTADEVLQRKREGYHPRDHYDRDEELREVLDLIASGYFSVGTPGLFQPILENLLHHDPFMVLADYRAYADCQAQVSEAWKDEDRWARMAVLNVARMGRFSSDRTIREYAEEIWRASPVTVTLDAAD